MLKLEGITKIYGTGDARVVALDGINLAINQGELIAIVGPSGSGKSSLINILGLIASPTKGSYLLNNIRVDTLGENKQASVRNGTFGYIVQNFALMKDMTVKKNIEIPLEYSNKKNKGSQFDALVRMFDLEGKLSALPSELSGGQKQRVAIVRALINNPDIILADEPTGSLDQAMGTTVMDALLSINKQGITVIVVTHDLAVAQRCHRIITMVDGCIEKDITSGNS